VAAGGAVESIPHTWVTATRQIEYMMTVNVDRNAEHSMGALVVLPGVSSTYRTRVLREMGFEHDTIAEDFDLTFRLQRERRRIVMNLRAKVYTSDPPTLSSYRKQLLRWYTDFWLVLRKHRKVLGKRVFGTVEIPMLVLNATVTSVLYLVLPFVFLFTDPRHLLTWLLTGLALDVVLVTVAWRAYRRTDVWWSLLSRMPTRLIGRTAFLVAMVRVLVGRPGTAWEKLERRGTAKFLASTSASSPR
jgi:cellulose synthase/poly-beta-1,6-N-acetylglucosamine synthase-like glycosyltransferase